MADTLHFDDATHTYTLRPSGIVLPSVSAVLEPIVDLSAIPKAVLAKAAARGTAAHRACELWDLGDLDEESLDPQLVPYLAAWKAFRVKFPCDWTAIETPEYHQRLMYAGTPDRRGVYLVDQKRILVDIKATYALNPQVQVQLSGYELMQDNVDELWAVRLCKDGTYQREVIERDHATFLACLRILNWKRKHA